MKKFSTKKFSVVVAGLVTLLNLPVLAYAYQAAPFATTKSPTYITEKSAQLNGAVNPNEMSDTYQWFEWGISGQNNTVYETQHRSMWSGSTMSNTNTTLNGLAPETQYFYRQVAENSRGKTVGVTTYFTTKPLQSQVIPIVIVSTEKADVTDTGATLKGYISPHTNTSVRWWFEWGATSKLENATPHGNWGSNSGEVKTSITGLSSGTVYYYRIVAENSLGLVYGSTQVFVTPGTPPPPPEAPHEQAIPTPQASTDGVNRTITTNVTPRGSSASGSGSGNMLPGVGENKPGDIFSVLFGKKNNTTNTTQTGTAANNSNAAAQTAAVGASTPLGSFWNALTGKKGVEVAVEKIGAQKVPAHTAVEYRISYAYRLNDPATSAQLKFILPSTVVYVGDNTVNELLLEEGVGPERTYVLPVGRLESGSTRTISVLGITTGDANGTVPDVRARLEYLDSTGSLVVVSGNVPATSSQSAAAGASSGGFLPSSLFAWIIYVGLLVGVIFGVRKAKAYYDERKAEIAMEEERVKRAQEYTPQWNQGELPAAQ